jgi:predicted NAD/FAD-binding protein
MPGSGKKKIVIIGAGAAGVFTAYLMKRFGGGCFEITILEEKGQVGGHTISRTRSRAGQNVNIDGGAQFFSETAQPLYCAMLRAEGIFGMPGVVIQRDVGVTLWNVTSKGLLFRVPTSVPQIIVEAIADPLNWLNFILLTKAAILLHLSPNWSLTFGAWLDSLPFLITPADAEAFKAKIARPLMYQFGLVEPDDLGSLSARFVVFYYVGSLPWLGGVAPFRIYNSEIGLDGILEKLIDKYGLGPSVKLCSKVGSIAPQGVGYAVTTEDGSSFDADEVVFAINPQWILPLLPADAKFNAVRNVLSGMTYLQVPVHVEDTDTPTHMPAFPDWSVSNVLVADDAAGDPTHYMLSVWFGPLRTQPIAAKFFKSWGSPSLTPAGPVATLEQTHHLMVGTPDFIARRETLRTTHQGAHHLWYSGGYIVDYDSQNACLRSAVNVAFQLIYNCLTAPLLAEPGVSEAALADQDAAEFLGGTLFRRSPELLEEIERQIVENNPEHPAVRAWLERERNGG